jgi:hypothetical protein
MSDTCAICLQSMEEDALCKTVCGHTFHSSCIFKVIITNPVCPLCRYELTPINNDINQRMPHNVHVNTVEIAPNLRSGLVGWYPQLSTTYNVTNHRLAPSLDLLNEQINEMFLDTVRGVHTPPRINRRLRIHPQISQVFR